MEKINTRIQMEQIDSANYLEMKDFVDCLEAY